MSVSQIPDHSRAGTPSYPTLSARNITFIQIAWAAMSFATGPPGLIANTLHRAHGGKPLKSLQSPSTRPSSSGRSSSNGTKAFRVAMEWSPNALSTFLSFVYDVEGLEGQEDVDKKKEQTRATIVSFSCLAAKARFCFGCPTEYRLGLAPSDQVCTAPCLPSTNRSSLDKIGSTTVIVSHYGTVQFCN